jgi:hypothetical protein
VASVQLGQEPVAGGHLLEPLTLQAQGGDAGRGRGQEPVAVQLPGMPRDTQGEGLARPRPPHHEGDALATLAHISDHRLLVTAGSGMGGQGITQRLMGSDRRMFLHPAGGADDETLLHRQEVGGRPAALLKRPVGDHADRPLGQEPVGQRLQLAPSGPGQAGAQGDQDVGADKRGRGRGQPVRASQPIDQPDSSFSGHCPILVPVGCPVGDRADQRVRVVSALGRLGPPSAILGVRGFVLLRLSGRVHSPLDQPRRPLPTLLD